MALNKENTIFEILQAHPETLEVFIANGFEKFSDQKVLESVGKYLKLESALKTKGYDVDTFIGLLEEKVAIQLTNRDITTRTHAKADAQVAGLLPCPVRIPLLENFDNFIASYEESTGIKVNYKLEAASVGADWMEESIRIAKDASVLNDIYLSAGFETFFDNALFGKFKAENVFVDTTPDAVNKDFANLGLKDPKKHYGIVGVVPAVFLADKKELGDIPAPRTWADLLKPEYAGRVSLPVGDFDLFNAILVSIYKEHGEEGVQKLGRSLMESMHPAAMVKTANKKNAAKPAVTIMPFFFTKMLKGIPTFEVIWPEDGAIISPIFMLVKRSRVEDLKPIADFFASKAVGEVLAHRGLFPSLNADVDNMLPAEASFKWAGWDYINNNDIGAIIRKADSIFRSFSDMAS